MINTQFPCNAMWGPKQEDGGKKKKEERGKKKVCVCVGGGGGGGGRKEGGGRKRGNKKVRKTKGKMEEIYKLYRNRGKKIGMVQLGKGDSRCM